MPHARPRQNRLDLVRLQPPIYMRDAMYVIQCPCPCGHELCVQPVLANGHHVRALQGVQEGGINNVQPAMANLGDLQNQPVLMNPNHFAPENYVHQEPLRLEYPMYDPEEQPREYRRRNPRGMKRNRSSAGFDSDNDCDLDR